MSLSNLSALKFIFLNLNAKDLKLRDWSIYIFHVLKYSCLCYHYICNSLGPGVFKVSLKFSLNQILSSKNGVELSQGTVLGCALEPRRSPGCRCPEGLLGPGLASSSAGLGRGLQLALCGPEHTPCSLNTRRLS